MTRYVVCAPYITLRTMTPEGPRILGFYDGQPVPEDVPKEQIEHHLGTRQIRAVEEPKRAEPEPARAAQEAPAAASAPRAGSRGTGTKRE